MSRKTSSDKYDFSLLTEGTNILQKDSIVDWANLFGDNNPLILEIGCGNGHFLVNKALAFPDNNFIGIDIKPERVIKSIEKTKKLNLKNIKFLTDEGLHFISGYFKDNSLSLVYLLFPDPWPKKKHRKKRLLLKDEFIDALYKKLKEDGVFVYVTDYEEYFNASYEKIIKDARFDLENKSDNDEYSISIFGKKWKEEGRNFYSFAMRHKQKQAAN